MIIMTKYCLFGDRLNFFFGLELTFVTETEGSVNLLSKTGMLT